MSKKMILLVTTLLILQQASAMKELGMDAQFIDFSHGKQVDPQHRLADHAHNQNLMGDLSKAILTSSSTVFYKLMNSLRDPKMIQAGPERGLVDQWLPELKGANDQVIANLQNEQQTHSHRLWMLGSGSVQSLVSAPWLLLPYLSLERLCRVFKYGHTVDAREKLIHLVFLAPLIPSLYGLYNGGKKAYNGLRYNSFIGNKHLENLKIQALLAEISLEKELEEHAPVAELPKEGLNLQAQLAKPDDFN
jgi:hypothetical protein